MKTKVKVIAALSMAASLLTAPANAAEPKTLVIIDSGFNTDLLQGNVAAEACFIEYGKCPNGQASMTGPGAASLPTTAAAKDKTFSHGTQMAVIAKTVNPSVQLVLIRIVGQSAKGFANSYTTRGVSTALAWVQSNMQLNPAAVSISLGRTYKETACPIESGLQQQVASLKQTGVAVFASAGNGSKPDKVDYPACIPDVIAVGATDTRYSQRGVTGWIYPVMAISNGGLDLDVYALGRYNTLNVDGQPVVALGTSAATVALASKWTQSLSDGKTYAAQWESMVASFENAYRSMTVVFKMHYNLI